MDHGRAAIEDDPAQSGKRAASAVMCRYEGDDRRREEDAEVLLPDHLERLLHFGGGFAEARPQAGAQVLGVLGDAGDEQRLLVFVVVVDRRLRDPGAGSDQIDARALEPSSVKTWRAPATICWRLAGTTRSAAA